MEAHPGAIEDRHGALEAHHGAVEACSGAMESLSRALEAHMESILAQMGAFGTIGSHPDEVRHNRPKFDICRKKFFWRPCNVKIKFFTSSFHRPEF
jgi:hypothetical protein